MGRVLPGASFYDPGVDLSRTQRLILRALDGHEAERGELMEYLRPRLVLWAGSRLSGALRAKIEPDDIAQETLIAIHNGIGGFQGRDYRAFLGWVFRIAENRIRDAADHFGAKKRTPEILFAPGQTSPSTAAARTEEVALVVEAMEDLGEDHREVIRLRRFEEHSVREIAELKGRTENAIRILYCRALKALRAALDTRRASFESEESPDTPPKEAQ